MSDFLHKFNFDDWNAAFNVLTYLDDVAANWQGQLYHVSNRIHLPLLRDHADFGLVVAGIGWRGIGVRRQGEFDER